MKYVFPSEYNSYKAVAYQCKRRDLSAYKKKLKVQYVHSGNDKNTRIQFIYFKDTAAMLKKGMT